MLSIHMRGEEHCVLEGTLRDAGISLEQAIGLAWVERIGKKNGRRPTRMMGSGKGNMVELFLLRAGRMHVAATCVIVEQRLLLTVTMSACQLHTACQYKTLTVHRMSSRLSEL